MRWRSPIVSGACAIAHARRGVVSRSVWLPARHRPCDAIVMGACSSASCTEHALHTCPCCEWDARPRTHRATAIRYHFHRASGVPGTLGVHCPWPVHRPRGGQPSLALKNLKWVPPGMGGWPQLGPLVRDAHAPHGCLCDGRGTARGGFPNASTMADGSPGVGGSSIARSRGVVVPD